MTYQAKVIAGGKIVIPADLRRDLGIKDGDSLVVERDADGSLVIRTYQQVVHHVQRKLRDLRVASNAESVVDELLAERRVEAAREAAAFDRWNVREA